MKFSNPIAEAFWRACVTELEALKPGNVSVYADGHGMQAEDFLSSAEHCAGIMADPNLSVGERIFRGVEATRAAVNCNTNLGILLLCAPLAQAVIKDEGDSLQDKLQQVLQNLSVNDTDWVFRAIRLAEPGGLGDSEQHNVQHAAAAPLLDVMAFAAERDRIAYQYVHDFGDVFNIGLPLLQRHLLRGVELKWAVVGVFLNFLAKFPDSHIMRKFGAHCAEQVYKNAQDWQSVYNSYVQPEQSLELLLGWDRQLKQQDINPGTSADLTVATLFVQGLKNVYSASQHTRPEECVV